MIYEELKPGDVIQEGDEFAYYNCEGLGYGSLDWETVQLWRFGTPVKPDERIRRPVPKQVRDVLELITQYGGIEGEHHKTWVIDQVVRILTGPRYEEWVKEYEGEEVDGEPMYDWDTGTAP